MKGNLKTRNRNNIALIFTYKPKFVQKHLLSVLVCPIIFNPTNFRDSKPNQPLESWHYVLGALLPVFLVIGFVIIFFKYKKHQTDGKNKKMCNNLYLECKHSKG